MAAAKIHSDEYHKLLCEYADHLRRQGHNEATALALRMRSTALRDVISYVATYCKMSTHELRQHLQATTNDINDVRYEWLAALGRVVVLQADQISDAAERETDLHFGTACLEVALQHLPQNDAYKHYHRLHIETLGWNDQTATARDLLHSNNILDEYYYGYLHADLANPALAKSMLHFEAWREGFNRPFIENNLFPISESTFESGQYDYLLTEKPVPRQAGPLISVIMTSYKPEERSLKLAADSILRQSWRNLELIIVDDASPAEFAPILSRIESIDPRIKVLRGTENRGTYQARNVGFAAASGEYVTGQDSDDWSHPQRLEHQVQYLEANPEVSGVVVEAIRLNNDLVRMFPGRIPNRLCEVSLMLRANLANEIGGYIEARKGADSEFRRRIEHFTGNPVHGIEKPLYLIRIGHGSLSHSDFKPGWSHPARRSFWNSSQYWHENTQRNALRLDNETAQDYIPIPNKFRVLPETEPRHFDAVFVGDWRSYSGVQRQMVDEIKALRNAGKQVGIMQLDSVLSQSKEKVRIADQIQRLVNSNYVDEVISDENATTDLVLIHDPTVLHFAALDEIQMSADTTLITPAMPPQTENSVGGLYLPDICDAIALKIFHGAVYWNSSDPMVKSQLHEFEDSLFIDEADKPIVIDTSPWSLNQTHDQRDSPIIGRHAEDYELHWPNDFGVVTNLWPTGKSEDVRILGDARSLLRRHGMQTYPLNWIVFRDRDITPEAYMANVDFFIYFPDDSLCQSFSREALEAAASGAVVILPEQFAKTLGPVTVCTSAENVPQIIETLWNDLPQYQMSVRAIQQRINNNYSEEYLVAYLQQVQKHAYPVDQPVEKNAAH